MVSKHICLMFHGDKVIWEASHLLKGDAVVRYHSEHACQQVLGLSRNMCWRIVYPLDNLLTQLLKGAKAWLG